MLPLEPIILCLGGKQFSKVPLLLSPVPGEFQFLIFYHLFSFSMLSFSMLAFQCLCRMCGERGESVYHLVSECSRLAQREYKRRHDDVARYIHWQLCEKGGFERASNWYEQKPEGVLEHENYKLLCDFTIQCDRMVEARRPDIIFVDKKKR